MNGFVKDIERIATENTDFRHVLYTAEFCQLVVMSLKPGEEIGLETHTLDQFFRVEQGKGEALLDGAHRPISAGYAILVPAGAKHNIINTGDMPLKLYTLYAPPNHRDGVIHATRADTAKDTEKFDGRTTENKTGSRRIEVKGVDSREIIPISLRPRLSLFSSSSSTART